MVPLSLGEPDPVRRLELIVAETAARKLKPRPQAGSGIFRFIVCQRIWYRLFPRQRSVNIVVTNAPGPPASFYLAGARLKELFPMMPPMGNLTLVVAALSYDGQFNLTASADRESSSDLEVFAQGMRDALADLKGAVVSAGAASHSDRPDEIVVNPARPGPSGRAAAGSAVGGVGTTGRR
jgi:hypothetical protein